jgi:hypothetical protein
MASILTFPSLFRPFRTKDVALPRLPPKNTLRSLVSGRFDDAFLEVWGDHWQMDAGSMGKIPYKWRF